MEAFPVSKEIISYASSNKENTIYGVVWKPQAVQPAGIIQICHGMCEYTELYSEFAETMCANGFIVCGSDFLGHGHTAKNADELGFFASKHGYRYLIEDTHQLTSIMKNQYPETPYHLLGHSMGSFIARNYASCYGSDLNSLILSGTAGKIKWADIILVACRLLKKWKGERYRSKKINRLAFQHFLRKIESPKSGMDWISSDEDEIARRRKDPLCRFIFTVSGFEDIFRMINLCNKKSEILKMPKNLDVLLFTGENDPVSNYGTGIKHIEQMFLTCGIHHVSCKIYPNARHSMLHEISRKEVFDDIIHFLRKII